MIRYIVKAMRLKQWTKNAFVFAALVFDRKLLDLPSLKHVFAAFVLFCFLASSVYLINDVMDVEADRNHPVKKNRPIASGKLPVPIAIGTAVFLLLIALAGSYFLSMGLFIVCAVYFLLNMAYSKWLKHIAILDVLVIAACFVLRVVAGVSVINVERFSPWLYVVTTLFALYLGFGKRRAELVILVPENTTSHRKVLSGYSIDLIDQLITIVSATTIILYFFSTQSTAKSCHDADHPVRSIRCLPIFVPDPDPKSWWGT
jgi:4-hydroxybenzoate polyprenyltransferase